MADRNEMAASAGVSSWVAAQRERVGWGVQAFALPEDPTPSRTVLAAGRLAETLGFDAFFIGDHPAYATECWLHLAVLADSTERIRLGSIVNCVLYRHPVMLARLAADLDHLSAGRLLLGLGIGWNATEFAQLGLPFPPVPERQAALEEAIAILHGVWGDEPFTYAGRFFWTEEERVAPPPVQQPAPPLIIAGAGERVTLRQVARLADACNFGAGRQVGGVRTFDDVRHKLAVLRRHCDEVGRPYEAILKTHFTSWLMLAEDEAAVAAKVARYYPADIPEELRASRIVGTPDVAVDYYQGLVDAGIEYFVVQTLDAGDTETIELLAERVAPNVSGLQPTSRALSGRGLPRPVARRATTRSLRADCRPAADRARQASPLRRWDRGCSIKQWPGITPLREMAIETNGACGALHPMKAVSVRGYDQWVYRRDPSAVDNRLHWWA
jgi:alkanesulfonate monooxygenase SsuD/methylene tetrahydromethanopterin reductase-like flavin-dependent oxidoreductase (luciferase family)